MHPLLYLGDNKVGGDILQCQQTTFPASAQVKHPAPALLTLNVE